MKNVTKYNKKTCIFKTEDEMYDDIKTVFGPTADIECSIEGIDFTRIVDNGGDEEYRPETETIPNNELFSKLAEYYDVQEITSIHIDDCDMVGIWICYKE